MESSQTIAFIDEAELQLRTIRNGILVSRQEAQPATIHWTAAIAGLREKAVRLELANIAVVLEAVESGFGELFAPGLPITEAMAGSMLDLIAHAEAEVVKLRFAQDDRDLGSFVDESFECLIGPADLEAPTQVETGSDDAEDEFEPDAEMLEIFAMEAEELLANIEANLARLSSSPSDRDALWEVRRHAHTFKGAAGIIGLKKPSKLAHRIEDLLDHLAQEEIIPDQPILELIAAATDRLRAITGGDATPGADARTTAVYETFDKVMASLTHGPLPVVPESEPKAEGSRPAESSNPPIQEATSVRRPIVRVSIGRLDNLVRVVRDLVVSRSAVEQRLAGLEAQLEALGKTTRRLQSAHAKLENDHEASMLRSFVPSLFSRPGTYVGGGEASSDTADTDRFDALEFDRYTDFHESTRELSEAIQDCFSLGTSLEALKASLETVIEDQRRLIEETQEKVIQIRLIKFESLATRLERAVRITCEEEHKKADVVLENPHIELDTDVLDSLVEPLIHLIRNAVVHGIEMPETRRLLGKPEAGRITIRVSDQETHIELKVSDDGRGIDAAALRNRAIETGMLRHDVDPAGELMHLLTLPGLTTAERLTMSAGRGVGMGIVKESVAARGGTLSVETALQLGTSFTIKVPLAFAVTQALLVRSERRLAAVPFKVVKRVIEISPEDLRRDGQMTTLETASGLYTVYQLGDLFPPRPHEMSGPLNVLLIETDSERFALVVDEILRTEEVAVKPLGKPLDRIAGVLGAAVLGNGEVAPVLDVSYFANSRPRMRPAKPAKPEPVEKKTIVLVVDDSPSVRHMTSKAVKSAGWTALAAKDGIEALEILNGDQLPDVILTDVEMPRMDGYELAAALRSHETFCDIPLIFITSRAGEKHREKAAELGVKEYLTKPFLDGELVDTVERLTEPAVRA